MRTLIAFDKFKDALDARAACEAAAEALRAKHPDWMLDLCPLTDGGEGFTEILTGAAGGKLESLDVSGPRGALTQASIGFVREEKLPQASSSQGGARPPSFAKASDGRPGALMDLIGAKPAQRASSTSRQPPQSVIAVIDLATASGLALLPPAERDPWLTTTRGTGTLIRTASERGATSLLLGIGGSATNDLGLGALVELGFTFRDRDGQAVTVPTPATWETIVRIVRSDVTLPPVFIACDVTNPLLGPRGATATFGPQKGLRSDDLPRLEAQMARMAAMLCDACGQSRSLADVPGTGAAGGIGFGLMAAFGARLVPGFDLVSDWLDLSARIAAADLVLTGEGRYDATSLGGKGPGRLVSEATKLGKPVHVFAGSLGVPENKAHHAITPAGLPLTEALPQTARLLSAAIARVL